MVNYTLALRTLQYVYVIALYTFRYVRNENSRLLDKLRKILGSPYILAKQVDRVKAALLPD